jgi:dienelactone hydrolase
MARLRTWSIAIAVVLIAFWIFTPMARAMWLLHDVQHPMGNPPIIAGKQSLDAHFYTTDDSTSSNPNVDPNPIPIAGWLVVTNQKAPTVILLPGWKEDRNSMLKYADFLVRGGLNVLLIDMQGSGHSGGTFTLGFDEPTDVKAAVSYLDTYQGISNHHYGVLGVGFGAGVGIAAAGGDGNPYPGDPEISAIVADSPWATEDAEINNLNQISIGGLTIPFPRTDRFFGHAMPPDAWWTVDQTIGGSPDQRSALQGAAHLQAQQALFIIYGDHPSDPSITQAAAQQLYQTTTVTHKEYWDAPQTGQGDAYDDQPAAYSTKVLAFFKSYLVSLKDPSVTTPGNVGTPVTPGSLGH